MKYLFLFILLLMQSCNLFRPITIQRYTETVKTDTINYIIPRPEIRQTQNVILSDTILIETPELSIELIRLPSKDPNKKDSLTIISIIKPQTDTVKVAQKTITKETVQTQIKKETPWYTWILIGGLIALVVLVIIKK